MQGGTATTYTCSARFLSGPICVVQLSRSTVKNQLPLANYKKKNRLRKFIGSGQFGTVMKGVWLLPGGSKDVAVKMLKEDSPEEDTVKFLQEAAIHGQFWHPNVVKLMGVVTVGEPVSGH